MVCTMQGLQTVTDFYEQAREFQAAHGDVRKALQERSPELVCGGQWLEAALRVQTTIASEMHRMQGVLQAINKSAMTDAEKLKATDAVASGMLATAKLALQAMAQAKKTLH